MKVRFQRRVLLRFPKSVLGRAVLGAGFLAAVLLAALGLVAGSVWIEDRHPCDDPARALMPGVQRVVTRPIVAALGRQMERHVRRRAEMLYMTTGLTLDQTIATFLDENIDLSERRIHAYRLARVGSPECIAALLKVLRGAPPEHRAFMAQLIGSTGNPAAKEWLLPLLNDGDEEVVMAALRGLGAIGGDEVAGKIAGILADPSRSEAVRIAAALGLGTLGTPAASDALVRALDRMPSDDLTVEILGGLGSFDFAEVGGTFVRYLAAPETPGELRVASVESLAHSSEQAVPFLLGVAAGDADPEVRASAAWAVSAHVTVRDLGPELVRMAGAEPEPDVRRRLYEAMLTQSEVAPEGLLDRVRAEENLAARVAGFNAIGAAVGRQPDAAAVFDGEIAPELLRIATEPNSLNLQMRAVFALRRAGTPAAREALVRISIHAPPQVATAARHGLVAAKR